MIISSAVMTAVECLHPLRGADHSHAGSMIKGSRTAMSGGSQSTQESQDFMRGRSSFKVWSTGTEHTEKGKTEIVRVEAEYMFQVPSVLAEPSELQGSLPTSGWRLGSISSLENQSLTLGMKITEWLCRSAEEMMKLP